MKKKFWVFPLLAVFVLAACGKLGISDLLDSSSESSTDSSGELVTDTSNSGDATSDTSNDTSNSGDATSDTSNDTSSSGGVSSDSSSDSSSTTDPVGKNEIDPAELNTIVGYDVYSQLPKVYSDDYAVFDESDEDYPINAYVDLYDWTDDDVVDYDNALFLSLDVDEDNGYILNENLFVYIYNDLDYGAAYINIYSIAETEPIEKAEIDPTDLNAILGFDVYSQIPQIFSNDYEILDNASEDYPIDAYVFAFDWTIDDAYAYLDALDLVLDYDDANGYILGENLFLIVFQDTQNFETTVYGVNIYSIAETEPIEKAEIDPAELNAILGFDVYSQIPQIYSNEYNISDESSEDYPIDVFVYLWDWTYDDAVAYDDALYLSLELDYDYGYILGENLFIIVNYDSDYEVAYIVIYSDASYEPFEPEVSAVWPADAINSFFGSADIGGLVPSFTSEADFSYYITGEDDYAELIIYTDYATVDGEDIYVAALEAAGWVVDDSAYAYIGYVANDPDEQISLIFYWDEGVIYWSFMSFYHEPDPSDGSVIFDFSDESSLVTKDANLSIWNLEPVTMAIAKNTSATNVGNVSFFSNPLRIYGGQQVTFSIEENYVIDEIVITTDGASYASVVSSAVLTGGTVLVEGSVVTITADGSGEDIVIVPSAQTRWLSVDISYTVAIV